MPRIRDARKANLAGQRYGKGAIVFVTQQELDEAFAGKAPERVRYMVKPWGKKSVIIHFQQDWSEE